ncbi:MAG: tRNA lysidine(34) synthetase TilS [Alphaproteobacteria bacterium]
MRDVPHSLKKKFFFYLNQFAPFEKKPTLAVALSGGPDSLALLKLTAEWTKDHGGTVLALHVDHKLRPESTSEAKQVKKWCDDWGIKCHILTWKHSTLTTKLQEQARKARYTLLEDSCKEQGVLHLLVAHHKQDEQETLQMRHDKKSGPFGMAGISACLEKPFLRILRPLLNFTKDELLSVLENHPYLQDPSNENLKFHRARLRTAPPEDLLPKDPVLRPLMEANLAVDLATKVTLSESGWASIDTSTLQNHLLWAHVLRSIGGKYYLPSQTQIETLFKSLKNPDFTKTTCGGCTILKRNNTYVALREYGRVTAVSLTNKIPFLWDNRFWVSALAPAALTQDISLGILGTKGWLQIKDKISEPFFRESILTLPTLWQNGKAIEIPYLGILHQKSPLVYLHFQPLNAMLGQRFIALDVKEPASK